MRMVTFVTLASMFGCASFWREGFAAVFGGEQTAKSSDRAEAFSHFLAAMVYERHGRFDKASDELNKAAANAPDSATLTLRLIRTRLKHQDYEGALAAAERAVQQIPNNANLWIVRGEIQHQLKRDDKAVESFQKAITIDPENVMGLGALVSVQESTNDFVAAADIYRKLAELTPDSAVVQFQLGLSLARINEPEGARAALKRALDLRPDLARAHFMLGILDMEAEDNAAAAEHLATYIKNSPEDARARENLAGVLGRLKRYGEASDALAAILSGQDAAARRHIEATYLLLRAGRYKEADEMIPADGALAFGAILRALARKGMGEPHRPLLESLDAIETDIDKECGQFLNELLYLFGKADAGDYLISALGEERKEGIQSKTLDIFFARVLMALDRQQEAESVLLDALNRYGPDKQLHYCLAVIYEGAKRIEDAEKHLKEYLKLQPDDPDVLNFLGYLYADYNFKLDEAEALLKKALAIDPDNGFYLDSLGWVYYRKGDADRAIEFIQRAIRSMENDDAELRDHLGDAYLLKGDVDKALAEWKRAQRLDPKLERVKPKIEQHEKTGKP
jgi:tetratricopeptide (TPR) repeat protein